MEEMIEKIGWKKLAIGLIGISLLGLLYVIFSFSTLDRSSNNASSARNGQNNIPIERNTSDTNFEVKKTTPSSETEKVELSKTFITPYYQISYPEIYAPTLYAEQEGVLNGLLLIDALGENRVEITVFDGNRTSIEKLSQIPISLGLIKGQTNVRQYLGESYSGVTPGMKVYEKIVLIKKGDTIVKFQLMELKGATKAGQEEFESILQSFQ